MVSMMIEVIFKLHVYSCYLIDDDFDVFRALAYQQPRLEVSVAIGESGFEPVQRVDEPTVGNVSIVTCGL